MSGAVGLFPAAALRLRILRLRFVLRARSDCRLPDYLGSTLRGALAMSLRRMVCTYDRPLCDGCPAQRTCPYPALFETPTATGTQEVKRMRDIPHPLLVEPPLRHRGRYRPGEELTFDAVLIGQAVNRVSYLIFAVGEMAAQGLGADRAPFALEAVLDEPGQVIYYSECGQLRIEPEPLTLGERMRREESSTLRIVLETPLRLKAGGSLMSREVEVAELLKHSCRRLWALTATHEPAGEEADFRPLLAQEPMPRLESSSLRWWDLTRYSNRQKSALKIGGLMGEFTLREVSQLWYEVLQAVEQVHVGKSTIMGLGKMRLIS